MKKKTKHPTSGSITLEVAVIAAALNVASEDTTRSNLGGVYIRNGEACATNGHILVTLKQDGPETWVSRAAAVAAKKLAGKDGLYELHWSGDERTLQCLDKNRMAAGTVPLPPLDGTFPDYKQVVPKFEEGRTVAFGFNPDLLAKLVAVARAASPFTKGITFEFDPYRNEFSPVSIRIETADDLGFHGVMMPMRMAGAHALSTDAEQPTPAKRPKLKSVPKEAATGCPPTRRRRAA